MEYLPKRKYHPHPRLRGNYRLIQYINLYQRIFYFNLSLNELALILKKITLITLSQFNRIKLGQSPSGK